MSLTTTPIASIALTIAAIIVAMSGKGQTFESGWAAPNDVVYSVLYDPGTNQVFIGGSFTAVGGQARSMLAAYNAATGALTSWAPSLDGWVGSMVVSGNTLYIGGAFQNIDGESREHLAAFDLNTGDLISGWHPDVDWYVYDMSLEAGKLYLAGDFNQIQGVTFYSVGGVDAGGFGSTVNWSGSYCDQMARSLSASGTTIYVGGDFNTIGGQSRNHIAALSTTSGQATPWNPNASDEVLAVVANGSTVYAGGSFYNIGGASRSHIAALNTSDGTATAWDPNANDYVGVIVPNGGIIYAGGGFTNIGSQSRKSFAALNANTGQATSWNADLADGPNDIYVYDIAVNGQYVYVGGDFVTVGGAVHPHFAVWSNVPQVVGIEDAGPMTSFSAWPNPTDGALQLDLKDPAAKVVDIIDALGRRILSLPFEQNIELGRLPAGIYTLTVRDGQGQAIARARVMRS